MAKEVKEVEFKGKIVRNICDNGDYKVYAVDVDKEIYPNIKFTKYGNAAISGELHELGIGIEYSIKATEEFTKNGYGYRVMNITRDRPNSSQDMYYFLQEILTLKQAEVLYEVYPDIVDRVVKNQLDDIDLDKLHGIKEYTFNVIKEKIVENFCLSELIIEFQGLISLSTLKKLYKKYTSINMVRTKLKEDGYKCLCGLSRIGFITADSILLELEKSNIIQFEYDLKTSKQRCLACMLYLLEENESNGHTRMNIKDLRSQIMKLCPACSNHFIECIKHDSVYYNKDSMVVALKSTYEIEKYIANRILDGLNCKGNVWDFDIEKYRNIDDINISDEQMDSLNKLCKNTISILNGSGGCVDCDTEYFNGMEWKKISEFSEGERVLQYNKDGRANLVYPKRYIKQKADYLWQFETKYGLDQCLSDEHNCYYITSKGNLYNKTFKEIRENQNNHGFTGKFITTFDYYGNGIDLTDDEIRLMVATLADGSFYNGTDCGEETYRQSRFHLKKERKKNRLIEICNRLNLEYREMPSVSEGYTDYYIQTPFRCKHFPKDWYFCTKHQFEIIAEEVMYWDGEYSKKNNYSTTNKNDADFIQFVFTVLGYRATINTYDRVGEEYLTNNKYYTRKSIEYVVNYTSRKLVSMCSDNRPSHIKTPINKYKTKDGYKYCFTVSSGILVLRRNNKIFITGNSGKSFSTQSIISMLKDNNKTFRLFSPTGKAAKVLSEYTKENATTIHRGLGYIPPNEWGYNEEYKLTCDVLIIDEYSMVDIFLFKRVLDAVDFNKTKLLMVGDNAQLPSVACGNLLHDFMQSNIIPTTTLTKVFRYGEGGLMKIATDVRMCKPYLNDINSQFTYFGDNKDYAFIDVDQSVIVKNTIALYEKLLSQGYNSEDIQVLTSYKKGDYGSITINNQLQKVANKNYGSYDYMKIGDVVYYKGDLIIQNVNNYKAEVYISDEWCEEPQKTLIANGETGVIKEICQSYALIDFDGVMIKYDRSDMLMCGLGYSISIHKSQGSSIKVVILLTPKAHTYMLNSNLIYVGLTRMKEKCYHLGNVKTVDIAVKKKENLTRNTFMQELLTNL